MLRLLRQRPEVAPQLSQAFSSAASSSSPYSALREKLRSADYEAYLCGSLLPSQARDSFFTLRALNAELASVREAARGNAATGRMRMAFWRDLVDKAFSGAAAGASGATAHPLFEPLKACLGRHKHTRRWLERLIDARDSDLDGSAPVSVAELEAFSEATHASLLYLSLEALGVRDLHADHAASHIGKALGIANVLRGFPLHARLGLRYMPEEVMLKVRRSSAQWPLPVEGRACRHAHSAPPPPPLTLSPSPLPLSFSPPLSMAWWRQTSS